MTSASSGPKSKRQKERIAEEEKKKETKSKTLLYAVIAVIAAVAVIAAAWFLFSGPGYTPSVESMKKNLEDNHFTVTAIDQAHLHGASAGINFSVTTDHGATTVFIYQFADGAAAKTFADSLTPSASLGVLVNGAFVLTGNHAHLIDGKYVLDEDIREMFNDLMHGRSVGHNTSHAH